MSEYVVERIDGLRVVGSALLDGMGLMSPFVWRLADGRLGILFRVVPDPALNDGITGRIWYGESDDGLHFVMDEKPVLVPDAEGLDAAGCEDPTVVSLADTVLVYYTGVARDGSNELLWACGPNVHALEKKGIALRSFRGEHNAKEAEISCQDGRWTIGYEFSRHGKSCVGVAEADGPSGPWRRGHAELTTREGSWDSWHLSPGPIIPARTGGLCMFYNGASQDAVWAIGCVIFDPATHHISERSEVPLIGPPGEELGRNISFAASCVIDDGRVLLFFSKNDRTMHRAVLTCSLGQQL